MDQMSDETADRVTVICGGKPSPEMERKIDEATAALTYFEEAHREPFRTAVAVLYAQIGSMPSPAQMVGCYVFWQAGYVQGKEAARPPAAG